MLEISEVMVPRASPMMETRLRAQIIWCSRVELDQLQFAVQFIVLWTLKPCSLKAVAIRRLWDLHL